MILHFRNNDQLKKILHDTAFFEEIKLLDEHLDKLDEESSRYIGKKWSVQRLKSEHRFPYGFGFRK